MSVDAQADVLIQRPREDVAKFMFDPKCDKLWIGGLVNSFPMTAGHLREGSKVEHDAEFLNKRYSAVMQVIKADPGRMVEMSVTEPFESKMRYQLDDVDGGTKVKIRLQSIGEIDYQQPPAVLNKLFLEKITNDLKRLKKRLEISAD